MAYDKTLKTLNPRLSAISFGDIAVVTYGSANKIAHGKRANAIMRNVMTRRASTEILLPRYPELTTKRQRNVKGTK